MKKQSQKKGTYIKWLLIVCTGILFAIFVRNLEQLFYEISAYHYQRELSSFEYSLKERDYSTIWHEVRRQQALGVKTMLDRKDFDALTEYYEASLWCYVLEWQQRGQQADLESVDLEELQQKQEEWEERREQAVNAFSSYRFRKAAEEIRQTFLP